MEKQVCHSLLYCAQVSPMKNNSSLPSFSGKITALWMVFLLGTLFHTQLAFMPLFHGIDIAQSYTHEVMALNTVMWLMLLFFCLPLLAIVGCVFSQARLLRRLHFGLTLLYSVLNLMHLVLDARIAAPVYQLALMALLLCIGLLLNWVAYQWMISSRRSPVRLKTAAPNC